MEIVIVVAVVLLVAIVQIRRRGSRLQRAELSPPPGDPSEQDTTS